MNEQVTLLVRSIAVEHVNAREHARSLTTLAGITKPRQAFRVISKQTDA
jgi:hypothetical protein